MLDRRIIDNLHFIYDSLGYMFIDKQRLGV